MSKASFTPGSWRVDPHYPADIQSGDGGLEISTTSSDILTGGVKPSRQEQFANARLIAAAPELYDIVSRLGTYLPTELQPEVDAVLAKARGE